MLYKKLFCSLLAILIVSSLSAKEKKSSTPIVTKEKESSEIVVLSDLSETTESAEISDDETYYEPVDYEKTKNEENFLSKFFTTEVPYKDYDEFEVYYKNTVTKIKNTNAVFAVFKDEDLAGFGVGMTACYYYTFFDRNARNRLIAAGEQYLKDFEEKKLVRKSGKTFRAYDRVNVKVRFGSLKSKANNISNPLAYFGYNFVNKSPYFHITILNGENERYEGNSAYPKESNAYDIYLTKAQLKRLMELLSDENVYQYVKVPAEKTSSKKVKKAVVSGDEY